MKIIRDRTVSFSGHRKLGLSPQTGLFSRYPVVGDSSGFMDGQRKIGDQTEIVNSEEGQSDPLGSSDTLRNQLIIRVEQEVEELCRQGYNTFMSGMAQGFDLLAAEAVLSVKRSIPEIRLIAVVPFSGQSRDFDASTKRLYDHILTNATETITLSQYYSPDCFHLRNDFLVDNSSVLICLFNGTKGGTAYTVKRAIKRGLRVINIDQ